ncbi:hypothetical protein ONZ51_g6634 [Trametes cubensis]|uniref:DUF6534 domain-containing protein n=1 Tax=Trametes cubensis TaxID=1111947 RepID=A0AAD7TRV6_9APHY|nr:hypothetical protein ONZ51_g6634 [Trametes cubensis]
MTLSLNSTFGAAFLGVVVGCIMYGVILYQALVYHQSFPGDALSLKLLVLAVLLVETTHTVLWIFVSYEYFVVGFLDLSSLYENNWYANLTIPVGQVTGLTHVIFYARQVYLAMPHHRWMVVLSSIIMMGAFAFSIVVTVKGFHAETLLELSEFNWIICCAYGFTVLAELLLSSALIVWLRSQKSVFKQTNSAISRVVTYTLNTGLVNIVVGLLVFVFALVYPRDLIYTGLSIVGIKLCSIAVLAMLNSRTELAARLAHQDTTTLSALRFGTMSTRGSESARQTGDIILTGTVTSADSFATA